MIENIQLLFNYGVLGIWMTVNIYREFKLFPKIENAIDRLTNKIDKL